MLACPTMHALLSTVEQYISTETLVALTVLSTVFFVGSLVAIPIILVHMPANFFDTRTPRLLMQDSHPAIRVAGRLLKNVAGAIFLGTGVLMLFLPGQGILTMLIGITMLDFPGKRKMEAKMIGQPIVLTTINGIRQKFGRPPLIFAPDP
jgi:hypothetical protein